MTQLLEVQHLTVTFERAGTALKAVDDLTLTSAAGETLGLVGESGSGKSVTALAVLRLLQPPGKVTGGRILFEGRDLLGLPESEMRSVRGGRISLIFQEPMTALNPTMRVGDQIAEALTAHGIGRDEARQRAAELLDAVRIPDPGARLRDYPHQLSGGMRQRVMIAIALACRPPLVIADEPTANLDSKTGGATSGRKVKGTIHWVSAAHAVDVEVRLYDRLFTVPEPDAAGDFKAHINPHSLEVVTAKAEPSLKDARAEHRYQFERLAYFALDKDSAEGKPIFNRTITLKDNWAKP